MVSVWPYRPSADGEQHHTRSVPITLKITTANECGFVWNPEPREDDEIENGAILTVSAGADVIIGQSREGG